jgi:hypothetical protein
LNPILDTHEYEVSFPDGSTDCYAANMIAESLYSQVDADGRELMLMKEMVDHRSDGSVVPVDNAYHVDPNGRMSRRTTTKGWKLLIEWKDGTMDLLPLKDLKESYLVQVAEYLVGRQIDSEQGAAGRKEGGPTRGRTRMRTRTHPSSKSVCRGSRDGNAKTTGTTAGVGLVGAVCPPEEGTDHPEGENTVLEMHS